MTLSDLRSEGKGTRGLRLETYNVVTAVPCTQYASAQIDTSAVGPKAFLGSALCGAGVDLAALWCQQTHMPRHCRLSTCFYAPRRLLRSLKCSLIYRKEL